MTNDFPTRTEIVCDTCIDDSLTLRVYVWQDGDIASSFEVLREATVCVASTGHLTLERVTKAMLTMAPERELFFRVTPEARNALEHSMIDGGAKRMDNTFTRVCTTGQ